MDRVKAEPILEEARDRMRAAVTKSIRGGLPRTEPLTRMQAEQMMEGLMKGFSDALEVVLARLD